MRYRFVTADVFTDQPFGGNPLAVLPDARGLDDALMQKIAREFNLSETVFVLPPDAAGAHPQAAHLHADDRGAVRRPPDRRHRAGAGPARRSCRCRARPRASCSRRAPGRCR